MNTDLMPRAEIARLTPETPRATQEQPGSVLALIERLATDPRTNVDTLERLLQMQERVLEREARATFTQAMVDMKPKLPVIERRGMIVIPSKDPNKPDQRTPFAKWEDIDQAITPVMQAHGFALSFRSGVALDGKITVTGVLAHRGGHVEETTITLPHDSSGSKNAVQAVGSSTSYGKRYTATLLLNLRTKGEDDDGDKGGMPGVISDEQLKAIRDLIDETNANIAKFCGHFKIAALPDLPATRYDEAIALLNQKKGKA